MRTTLSIDDDVLSAAERLGEHPCNSLGEVVSALARQALRDGVAMGKKMSVRNGIPLWPERDGTAPVTLDCVNPWRDDPP